MKAWYKVTNRKFEATMRYCHGEDSQEKFELKRARLRRKHGNSGMCERFCDIQVRGL
jgi:hypothetical protein